MPRRANGRSIVAADADADAHRATIAAHTHPEGRLRIWISFSGQPPDATRALA
jgi:hypothetical protein